MRKIKTHYLFLFLLVLGFVLRFYKLGAVPLGLYQDETAIGYNAYSILKTGRDEYGKKFPMYFKSFGDYKLPVYVYLTSGAIWLFGMTEFAVRFPSALFGFLTLPLAYLLIKKLTPHQKSGAGYTGKQNLALLAVGLLAINPWHLHYSRAAFEVSVGLFLLAAGWLLIANYFDKRKVIGLIMASTIFSLAAYTYNLTRILAPLLYAGLFLIHGNSAKLQNKFRKRDVWLGLVIFLVLMLPMGLTMAKPGGAGSAAGTLINTSAPIQAQILEFRGYLIKSPVVIRKFIFNQSTLTGWRYLKNIAGYFSVDFFFLNGSSHGNHGLGDMGQFYLFELPLILSGMAIIWRKKGIFGRSLLCWLILTVLTAALTREAPHATRSFFLILPMVIFSALGLLNTVDWLWRKKQIGYMTLLLFLILSLIVIFNLTYYFVDYYLVFPGKYARSWRAAEKELAEYLGSEEPKYQKIIIDKSADVKYTALLFYQKYSPLDFQQTAARTDDDSEGFNEVQKFGKYEIKDVNWDQDLEDDQSLVVTLAGKEKGRIIKTFYYPERPVAFAVKQQIYQMPIQEIAFVAVVRKE